MIDFIFYLFFIYYVFNIFTCLIFSEIKISQQNHTC